MFETTTSLSLRRLVPAALFMLAALAGAAAGPEQDCPTPARQCASCHKLDYICPKMAEGGSSLYWKRTISDMVDEGAVLTGREQAVLVRCLSSRDARAGPSAPAPTSRTLLRCSPPAGVVPPARGRCRVATPRPFLPARPRTKPPPAAGPPAMTRDRSCAAAPPGRFRPGGPPAPMVHPGIGLTFHSVFLEIIISVFPARSPCRQRRNGISL